MERLMRDKRRKYRTIQIKQIDNRHRDLYTQTENKCEKRNKDNTKIYIKIDRRGNTYRNRWIEKKQKEKERREEVRKMGKDNTIIKKNIKKERREEVREKKKDNAIISFICFHQPCLTLSPAVSQNIICRYETQ